MKKVICVLLTVVFGVSAAGADTVVGLVPYNNENVRTDSVVSYNYNNDIRPNSCERVNYTKPHTELAKSELSHAELAKPELSRAELAVSSTADDDDVRPMNLMDLSALMGLMNFSNPLGPKKSMMLRVLQSLVRTLIDKLIFARFSLTSSLLRGFFEIENPNDGIDRVRALWNYIKYAL